MISVKRQITADITTITEGAILHQVNCQDKLGAGVALALATKYPKVKQRYHAFTKKYPTPDDRFGLIQVIRVTDTLLVCNSFTQMDYGNADVTGKVYTDEYALKNSLERFDNYTKRLGIQGYVPHRIGCGLAGGDWKVIKRFILENTDLTIVKLPK
jgi:hypothetical protein